MRRGLFVLGYCLAVMCLAGAGAGVAAEGRTCLTAEQATRIMNAGGAEAARPHRMTLAPAKWIWLPSTRTLSNTFVLFRKDVVLEGAPVRAAGWICADSRYRLTVNGKRVQWGPAPCDPRALDADPIDLLPYLKPGKNTIGAEVLFFGEGDGTWPGGKPGLLFNATIETAGGKRMEVVSDESWMTRLDRAHPPGQHKRWFLRALQEEFDARLHPEGWNLPEHAPDAQWIAAMDTGAPPDKPSGCVPAKMYAGDTVDRVDPQVSSLRMRQIPPAREVEIAALRQAESGRVRWLRPAEDWFDMRVPGSFEIETNPVAEAQGERAWKLPATPGADQGVYATFEFTEQIIGHPYFTIEAPAGTIVEAMVQESHDPANTAWLDTYHFCWSRFICREGVNRFETFDYESFRWLQLHVRGATRPVVIRDVGVRRRMFPWPEAPAARCSEPALQRLIDASINTLHNSAIETIMDGGGRERQQYSGDGGHQLHAIRMALGEPRICARFLRTFSEGLALDGYFMDCWPAYDRLARVAQKEVDAAFWGPLLDHGVGFVFDNWNHYLETGDLAATDETYPRLVRFARYLETIRDEHGLLKVENLGIPTVWVDHTAYKKPAHKQCAFNLYAAAMFTHALAPLAEARGDAEEARRARRQGGELLEAARARFWSEEKKLFVDNLPWLGAGEAPRLSDRALATSVLFDQCPGGDTAAAIQALADCPKEMGLSYPCNAGWRYWALARGGRIDVVLADLRTKWATMPSVLQNNTLQEGWRAVADAGSQWSHCPLAPLYVLHQDIAGIRPEAPGFKRVRIRPQLGDLPDLELSTWTPLGRIEFKAVRAGAGHRVNLILPEGCSGEVLLLKGSKTDLRPVKGDGKEEIMRYELPDGAAAAFFVGK